MGLLSGERAGPPAALLTNIGLDALLPAVEMHQAFIDDELLWKQRWHAVTEPPKTALDAYRACNTSLYPNLSILRQVLVTLPITTACTPELALLPFPLSNLRSSMGDEWLTSLALIHVHAQTVRVRQS